MYTWLSSSCFTSFNVPKSPNWSHTARPSPPLSNTVSFHLGQLLTHPDIMFLHRSSWWQTHHQCFLLHLHAIMCFREWPGLLFNKTTPNVSNLLISISRFISICFPSMVITFFMLVSRFCLRDIVSLLGHNPNKHRLSHFDLKLIFVSFYFFFYIYRKYQ